MQLPIAVDIKLDAERPTNQNSASFRYGLYIVSSPFLAFLKLGVFPFRLWAMIGRNPRDTDDAKIRPKWNVMITVDRKNERITSRSCIFTYQNVSYLM